MNSESVFIRVHPWLKSENHRGRVSLERRRQIRAKIRDIFRLAATD